MTYRNIVLGNREAPGRYEHGHLPDDLDRRVQTLHRP